ncbi:MAG: ATP-binding protein [Myxococcales bacterium]|nr:ATP-binding protein [Myxococcales bacterium]
MQEARRIAAGGEGAGFWAELWLRTALRGALLVAVLFGLYEILERTWLADADLEVLHKLHLARGLTSSFVLATWAFLNVRRARLERDRELETSLALLEERVQARTRELEEARAFTELLFDTMRERIVVRDESGRVVKQNKAAREAQVPGRAWEIETVEVPPSASGGGLVIEVQRDVTETRELEAQVRHQEKMASLGLLAAGIAHDLGNPLASLSTELELLEDERDPAVMRDSLGVLARHVGRMTRTLRGVVDFARRRGDDVTDVEIADAVEDSVRLVCHDPRWTHVQLDTRLAADLPPVTMVEDQLVLVLVNVLLNAVDAMSGKGSIHIEARHGDGEVTLTIEDDGIGMPPEVLAQAMKPLFTTKGDRRGTGLGLAVCERVVRAAGGALTLQSASGRGTTVSIVLPASRGKRHG